MACVQLGYVFKYVSTLICTRVGLRLRNGHQINKTKGTLVHERERLSWYPWSGYPWSGTLSLGIPSLCIPGLGTPGLCTLVWAPMVWVDLVRVPPVWAAPV